MKTSMSPHTLKSLKQMALMIVVVIAGLVIAAFVRAQSGGIRQVFLPVITNNFYSGFTSDRKFIGIYMEQYWTDNAVQTYLPQADQLAGKKHSVVGWFIDLQNIAFTDRQTDILTNNFYRQLEALWQGGYISFVNIGSGTTEDSWLTNENCPIPFTAYQVARGDCDRAIQKMADLYKQWISKGEGRKAFLAPLQEMNGVNSNGKPWTTYGGDANNFKLAYQRIQNIFAQKGVVRSKAWWVFAPNGWSEAEHNFEYYYPGDDVTDVLAFSSYNFGYCPVAIPWQKWESYDTLFASYIERMQKMAPAKPIIIAQTGTTAQYQQTGIYINEMKNQWLIDNYTYLASQPAVLGVLYYDITLECDWPITQGGTFSGYTQGAANTAYQYMGIQDLSGLGF